MNTYVYLIRANGAYKIGMTTNLKARMSVLTSEQGDLHCLWLLATDLQLHGYHLERAIHRLFRKARLNGRDWFALTEGDIEKFKALTPADLPGIHFEFSHVAPPMTKTHGIRRVIPFPSKVWERVIESARRERRSPHDQAVVLLEHYFAAKAVGTIPAAAPANGKEQ